MGVGSAQCSHWTTTAAPLVSAAVALLFFASPPLDAQNAFPFKEGGAIRGAVKSSGTAIPGVTITAANTLSGQKTSTSTDVNGKYNLEVTANGRYVVRAQIAAFAPSTQEVVIHDGALTAQADFELILLSRAQEFDRKREQQASAASGPANQGFRALSLLQSDRTSSGASGNGGMESVNSDLFAPGMSNTSGTESVSFSANTATSFANMSSEEMRQHFEEVRQQNDGLSGSGGGPGAGGVGGPGGGGPGGGPGPGFGGPGGGPPPFVLFGGNRGRLNLNRPHGSLFYTVGSDALNAAPYSLTGQPVTKPGYLQNQFGVNLGGVLRIPKVYANNKTFFFFNYNGSRSENPYDAFSTVPTTAERSGDFSHSQYQGNAVQIFNPYTGTVIPGNNLENSGLALSPIATGLLQYIPLPNVVGAGADTQNFHYVTTARNNSDDLNIRVNRSLGAGAAQFPPGPPGPGGFQGPHNDVLFGFHYHSSTTGLTNPFPSVGGGTTLRSFDIPLGYVHSFGKVTNLAHLDFNRSRTSTQNLYAFSQSVVGDLGIGGVSQNPFDWGLPNLSFVDFGSLTDTNPQLVRNQTWTFSDNMIWHSGKHTLGWGGDFRRIQLNTEASSDARGTFVFTGLNTAQTVNGTQLANTGFDFADFLLGIPEQTRLQTTEAGASNYHFRGNFWDLYAQEDWRMRGNLTLNLGVRYEYVSPFRELNDHIANLDVSPAFLANATVTSPNSVQLVLPGASSSYHGVYQSTLMHPDRNNFAPRIGIAWKPWKKTIVRAGYGINYNTTAYQNIAQQLAFQPPFATIATNVQTNAGSLTLQNGFPASVLPMCQTSGETDCQLTNNYAVNPDYRLGYVQFWNLNLQREIRPTLVLNVGYTGTKGTRLDILEAPNRDQAGVRLATVDAFNWQSSGADSHTSAGSVRLRKRLHAGFSVGGTYTFTKSIDDAATVGGTATMLAQNPFNLSAERALSSFSQTHKFTGDYLVELPFGHDKRWLFDASPWRAILGDWQLSGDWTIASGLPFTPTVLGADVESGTTGTVRPNVVPGASISIAEPTIQRWFNTAAFQAPASLANCNNPTDNPLSLPCVYGDARRNSIIGPGTLLVDMALTKVFSMREGRALEFRASASNVFNRPQYSSIDTTLNSPTLGQVTAVGSMRTIQLTARFRF